MEVLKQLESELKLAITSHNGYNHSEDHKGAIRELIEQHTIRPTAKIQKPAAAWGVINPETQNLQTVGTLGNFSLLIGKAKARKSFMIALTVAAATIRAKILDTVQSQLTEDKKQVVYIDTEQADWHVFKALDRICKISNTREPDNLRVIEGRSLEKEQLIDVVEYVIYNTPNLGLLVIDGIRDLVSSVNNEEEAHFISRKLLKWSAEANCHIITVLHQNKNDRNGRGHLGTELVNKAETVLEISKPEDNPDTSIVSPLQCRDKEPSKFAFGVDDDGLPFIAEFLEPRRNPPGRKPISEGNAADFTKLNEIYSIKGIYGKMELTRAIMEKFSIKSDKTARTRIVNWTSKGWLIEAPEGIKQGAFDGVPF